MSAAGYLPTVDLTLGVWRPREAATQLALALGVTLPPGIPADPAASPITIDRRGLDVSAAGDPIAFAAFADARAIAAALPPTGTLLILAPRFDAGIGTLNDWFLHFLKRSALRLVLVGEEPATAMARGTFERRDDDAPAPGPGVAALTGPQRDLLRFFPGLLPRRLAEQAGLDADAVGLLPVGATHLLVPPALRDTDPAAAPARLDAMAALEAEDDGFRALGESHCTAHFADSATLASLAAHAFHAGETELARRLAARARSVARDPPAAAAADLVGQTIRLHQHRYAEVLATPEPSRRADAATRDRLARIRLRAAVARGERSPPPELAAPLARLDAGTADAEDLDVLTLHVGTRLAPADAPEAAALATRIETASEACGDERVRIAALAVHAAAARRAGDTMNERRILGHLFAATSGSRTLAEVVAMNVRLARAEDDPASPAARGAWLRAAFAWLAFEPCEAFPAGAIEAVLGTASLPRGQVDKGVSEAIAQGLGPPGAPSGELLPAILRSDGRAVPERVIGGPGIVLGWTRAMDWAPPSPFRQRLITVAWGLLRRDHPGGDAREGTVVVDDNLGTDLPSTRDGALALALRLGVADVRYGEERITIDAAARARLAPDLRIGLSPAVAAIEAGDGRAHVRFRRILPDAVAEDRAAEALVALRDGGRMPLGTLAVLLGTPLGETEQVLRGLEAMRAVRITLAGRSPGSPTSSASA